MSTSQPPRRPAQGTDATGSITVDIDADGRVTDVAVNFVDDDLRRAPVFENAFDEALTRANGAALPAVEVVPGRSTTTARRITRPPRVPLSRLVEPHLGRPYREPRGTRGRTLIGGETGHSDNQCVTVELDRTGPGGRLSVDHGWLSNAAAANVSGAIRQAFEAAYRVREDQA